MSNDLIAILVGLILLGLIYAELRSSKDVLQKGSSLAGLENTVQRILSEVGSINYEIDEIVKDQGLTEMGRRRKQIEQDEH
jgi:glycerol-3-phosphate acyltransferase PlsY